MPTDSSYPAVDIPNVDLWGLMFEYKRKEGFPDQQGTSDTRSTDLLGPVHPTHLRPHANSQSSPLTSHLLLQSSTAPSIRPATTHTRPSNPPPSPSAKASAMPGNGKKATSSQFTHSM